MRRQDLRPYSRLAWEEKRRQWAIEQEQIKQRRLRVLALAALFVVVVGAIWAYVINPGGWKNKAGRYAKKIIDYGAGMTR